MKPIKALRIVCIGVLVTGLTVTGAAAAVGVSDVRMGKPSFVTTGSRQAIDLDAFSVAELEFLGASARQQGISLEEAVRAFGWHEPFSRLVADLREKYPDDFAGAAIEPVGSARAWIGFRAQASLDAVASIEAFPESVAVYVGRGFSEREVDDWMMAAHYQVLARRDLVSDVSSGYDIRTGRISIEVVPAATAGRMLTAQDMAGQWPEIPAGVKVDIIEVARIDAAQDTIYGGERLSLPNNQYCTAGLTVVGITTRGVSTAGHCDNAMRHGSDGLVFVREHLGQWGEFQWGYSVSQYHSNRFHSDWSTRPTADAVGTPALGQWLCRFGQTTGKRCDAVLHLNQCAGSVCRLAAMHQRLASPGDSGGPWYSGGTAYGIHQGVKAIGGPLRDVFSQVRWIQDALGVTIATS